MSTPEDGPDLTRSRDVQWFREGGYGGFFTVCAGVTVLTTIAIFLLLLDSTLKFAAETSMWAFLTGTNWSPGGTGEHVAYGMLPLVIGTLTVTIMAAFVSIPVGTLTAIYLSEYASPRTRSVLKPMLEILAGIPTVVYGIFALVYVTPALKALFFPDLPLFNALSASLMVGIMTIPMVSSISEDAMNAVPDELRQAGYSLGATKYEVSTGVVVPASLSGIASSYILAVSRAIGETMIVVVAMGQRANMPDVRHVGGVVPYVHPEDVLFEPGMTITVAMVDNATGDLVGGGTGYNALFALGLVLFTITLTLNVISDVIAARYREVY